MPPVTPALTARVNGQSVPMANLVAPVIVHRDNNGENAAVQQRAGKTAKSDAVAEAFTIVPRDNGKWQSNLPPPRFRVEPVDSGFRVRLDYYDQTGIRCRPYCCYLNAKEGDSLRKTSFEDATPVILKRVKERRPKNDAEREKIAAIVAILERLS